MIKLTGISRYLKGLYKEGKIGEKELDNAITKEWITEEEKDKIMLS